MGVKMRYSPVNTPGNHSERKAPPHAKAATHNYCNAIACRSRRSHKEQGPVSPEVADEAARKETIPT